MTESHPLETERLSFEPLCAAHAEVLFPAMSDPRVHEHIGNEPWKSVAELRARYNFLCAGPSDEKFGKEWVYFAVKLKGSQQFIGKLEATIYGSWAEIAYLFGSQFWGFGYAQESLVWFHNHLLRERAISDTWATVLPANLRSARLLLRSGYSEVAYPTDRKLLSYDPGDLVFRRQRVPTEN